jgi:Zn-dependent peptidase ImmA (M78 family)
MVTTQSSHRLVTDAFSWEQKASRAFAAELLAPRRVLAERISTSSADSDAIESLSREFKASTIVIERQLENAGISLSGE